ncbi:MAG TPA: Kae1-associated kinase Bud32 [Pyrodictium sp.]|nr:Kae1-associated kinase Bud32 [Pyrodictium sp.]
MESRRCAGAMEIEPRFKGAEAYLYLVEFAGMKALAKKRIAKEYRHRVLDERLRYERTVEEARTMLAALEAGVTVPSVLYVDPNEKLIIIEYIEGVVFRELIEVEGCSERVRKIARRLGENVAKLHLAGIAHGDVTTSNVIVSSNDTPFIIDFGLAKKTRDIKEHAVDVHLFLRSLESTHPEHRDCIYQVFIDGYRSVAGDYTDKILAKVNEIRLMGRYVEARRQRTIWSM